MKLSGPAKVLAIVYLILTTISVIAMILQKTFSVFTTLGTLLWLATASLIVYDTHCLTAGNCTTWSIIRTVLYLIIPVITIIVMLFALFQMKPKNEESTQ
jgi:hypothetical protein